ncbi:lysophospholipid acyltransferase family protein [Magnetovibrio sp.]|uniref:lysophospholipid acyltransferase family protein n=1 Tax=Magnetovibrio sp. TaxID=2024836 RepID=UPI002F94606A
MRFSPLRAGVKLGLFVVLVGVLLGPYALLLAAAPGKRHHIARLFFKGCAVLTGLRLKVRGMPGADIALFAANHSSYLDIPVLGAAVGGGVFVAKSEVADWPLFGFLARISRTVFISRNGADAAQQRELLAARMNKGASLILFPEGTSTDGSHVKRFKSSLFSALEDVTREAWVQPVSIVYARHKQGRALSQGERENYTWFGDMTLAPHLLNVFGISGCEVEVVFHPPLLASAFRDRKHLATACETVVANALQKSLGAPHNEDVFDLEFDPMLDPLMEPVPHVSGE